MFNQRSKKNNSVSKIIYSNNNSIDFLKNRIENLDLEIAHVTREIFNAQLVRARSMFSGQKNLIQNFQKRIVESSAVNSLSWHKRRLSEITFERDKLQDQLDRYTGKYWSKRIKRFFLFMGLWIFIAFMCSIILLGFAAVLYLLPLLGLILFIYLLIKKINI